MTRVKLPVFIVPGKSPLDSMGGGYSSYVVTLGRVLKALGHDVTIVALSNSSRDQSTDFGRVIHYKIPIIPISTVALPALPIVSILLARHIQKEAVNRKLARYIVWGMGPWGLAGVILKRNKTHVVHAVTSAFTMIDHEWKGMLRGLPAADYGPLLPFFFTVIGATMIKWLQLFENNVLTTSDLLVTNYKSTEQMLKRSFPNNPVPMRRIHFAITPYQKDTTRTTKITPALPSRFVLTICRQDPRKGINTLLHAAAYLAQNNTPIPFVIAGNGPMYQANMSLARKLGVTRQVTFLGYVPDVQTLLKKATIFCMPSLEEGAGSLAVNEAMLAGLPIVAADCDGIAEDITSGVTGILVPKQQPVELARALLTLWNNSGKAKRLGAAAHRIATKKYSLSLMKADVAALLDSLFQHPNQVR